MNTSELLESRNAMWKREDQLQRWDSSDTNKSSPVARPADKVRFQDSCVFLAACASGDSEEVSKLLQSSAADINTANVDGLTALHQACIDDNLEMVKFLLSQGADINVCDNEGWTALHATASCGFIDIARYLILQGASLSSVNNDGELAVDLADGTEMELMITEQMKLQGVDADSARNEEEDLMMRDVRQWMNSGQMSDEPHPVTGATALHVAAAKGYIKVLRLLIELGVDVEARDYDGWTPLHAAAHWAQEEACRILIENLVNMNAKTNNGETVLDVADTEIESSLLDMRRKQVELRNERKQNGTEETSNHRIETGLDDSERRENDRNCFIGKNNLKSEESGEAVVNISDKQEMSEALALPATPPLPATSPLLSSPPLPSSPPPGSADSVRRGEKREGSPADCTAITDAKKPATHNTVSATELSSTKDCSVTKRMMSSAERSADTQPLIRSFEPVKREEEKEIERKARAKRARETRRSTQGVCKEDLEKAEAVLKAAHTSSLALQSTTASTVTDTPASTATSTVFTSYSLRAAGRLPISSGLVEEPSGSAVTGSTATTTMRPSFQSDSTVSGSTVTTTMRPSVQSDSTVSRGDVSQTTDTNTPGSDGIEPLGSSRMSAFRSRYLREKAERESDRKCDSEPSTLNSSAEGRDVDEDDSYRWSSSRSRRKRETRPTTANNLYNSNSDGVDGVGVTRRQLVTSSTSTYTRFPYTTSSSSSSNRDIDYKKLYEEEKAVNEQLKRELKETQVEADEVRAQLAKIKTSSHSSIIRRSAAVNEPTNNTLHIEKLSLEKKISELEKELKDCAVLKGDLSSDNQRLKEENAALIRVISKLSK